MSDFVTIPFESDADDLTDTAIESLQEAIPGWEPADGNLDVWLLAAFARIASETTAVAASVPEAIFRAFGSQLIALPSLDGTAATITTTWTARDNAGYTVPAGTQVAHRVSGDVLIIFETTDDVAIPTGATSLAGVALTAVSVGVDSNAVPTGEMELIDALAWVDSILATTVSSGGVDPESDGAYLDRLTAELRLLTPRPILPEDFATLARRVDGVTRATAIDGYDPGLNEHQSVAVSGNPTAGSLTLTYSGQTTGPIPWNATSSEAATALIALSNIGPADVVVTGGPLPGTPLDVEFAGALASTNVPQMTAASSLTGGTTPGVAVVTTTAGVAPTTGNERMVCLFGLDSDGAPVTGSVRTAMKNYLDSLREVSFIVNAADATSTTIDVTFTVKVAVGFDTATVIAACEAAVADYLSPAAWAGGDDSPPVWRSGETTVRYLAMSTVIAQVDGVAYVGTLSINSGTSDVTLSGVAPLPTAGTVAGTAI